MRKALLVGIFGRPVRVESQVIVCLSSSLNIAPPEANIHTRTNGHV